MDYEGFNLLKEYMIYFTNRIFEKEEYLYKIKDWEINKKGPVPLPKHRIEPPMSFNQWLQEGKIKL